MSGRGSCNDAMREFVSRGGKVRQRLDRCQHVGALRSAGGEKNPKGGRRRREDGGERTAGHSARFLRRLVSPAKRRGKGLREQNGKEVANRGWDPNSEKVGSGCVVVTPPSTRNCRRVVVADGVEGVRGVRGKAGGVDVKSENGQTGNEDSANHSRGIVWGARPRRKGTIKLSQE